MLSQDTIRLVVEFRDFAGKVIHPTNITLKIYDEDEKLITTITEGINTDTTKYYYDYQADQTFIFEFSGIYNGLPVLARQLQKVKFY